MVQLKTSSLKGRAGKGRGISGFAQGCGVLCCVDKRTGNILSRYIELTCKKEMVTTLFRICIKVNLIDFLRTGFPWRLLVIQIS